MEFPGKVNTATSLPEPQGRQVHVMSLTMDIDFIRTIPGILLLVEIAFGLLVWTLISSVSYWLLPAYGWVLFVSVTFWILTVVLFIILLLGIRQKLSSVPWPLVLLVFYGVATVLYLTAFLANAITVPRFGSGHYYNNMAAAAFFGIVVTLTYGASALFAFMDWKGDGGNAAASTVPV